MGSATAKTAQHRAAAPRMRATVVDAFPDGVVVEVKVSDELLGALLRGRVDHFLVSIIGDEWEDALRSRLRAVK